MKIKTLLALLSTTAMIGFASAGYAADNSVETDYKSTGNGGYEASSSAQRTTSAGTKVTSDKKIDVEVDDDGTISKTTKSESKADAKGLFNTKKGVTEVETKKKADGDYTRKTTVKNVKDNGTNTSAKTETEVNVKDNGDVETNTTVEKKTDPKGLFNSTTEKSKVKMINGKVVEKKVD